MLSLALLLAACDRAPAPVARAPVDSGEAPADCTRGFSEEVVEWALPDLGQPLRSLDDTTCSGEGDERVRILDLDGDRMPDLVRVFDCDRASALGDTEWWVHRNTGAGFAPEAVAWPLPPVPEPYAFGKPSDGACEISPDHLFELTDLDGDLLPDLVVVSDCEPDTEPGGAAWHVYRNTGAGFADTPVVWAAPTELAADGWRTTSQDRCGAFNRDLFSLLDLTGDRKPELVRTAGCPEEGVGEPVALGRWDVWRNLGDGFASAPEAWALPTDHGGDDWGGLQGQACTQAPDHRYLTVDLTGDKVRDLVVTGACEDDQGYDTRWRVYAGTGAGFAEAVDWPLPPAEAYQAWERPFGGDCAERMEVKISMTDLDGDQARDLVVYGPCGGTTPSRWFYWSNTGDGFSPEVSFWWLPDDDEPLTWAQLSDPRCTDTADHLLFVTDLTGDRLPDVVETYGCDPDGPVGVEHWRVRVGGCLEQP